MGQRVTDASSNACEKVWVLSFLITQAKMNFDPEIAIYNSERFWHAKIKSGTQITLSLSLREL